jgi:hypothetical protein
MRNTRYKGIFLADFLTSIALLGVIITILATSTNAFSKFNHYQWARQRCIAAATAQLDSITATGSPIGEQELQRLWPFVNVTVERSGADGRWNGLELVQVTAVAREVKVRLVRYILPQPAAAKGGQN